MRLDKLLADAGIGSRSVVKRYIRQGNVTIDGRAADGPNQQIDPDTQTICCFGREVRYQKYAYYMFYKPMGCITARTDGMHPVVMDYIKENIRNLSPVGRLDLDTEGLLLITNDGQLSHALLSPAKHVPKVYEAKISAPVTNEDIKAFAEGVEIGDDTPAEPAELTVLKDGKTPYVQIVVTEGRYHQIKRMFTAIGKSVLFLKRTQMGSLRLDDSLSAGEYRELTCQETQALKGKKHV